MSINNKTNKSVFVSPGKWHNQWWMQEATLEHAIEQGLTDREFDAIVKLTDGSITVLEIAIFGALFSEHCSYKSSRSYLKSLPTHSPRVLQGPGENAGIIDIGDNQAVVFKIESHNHPSFIEPFEGAQTGVGGILRDIFTMGARPIALLNSLRFGNPTLKKTKELLQGTVKGIGNYGNCMGIPTVGGETYFHEAYNSNCLVNAFAIGLVEHNKIFKGSATGVDNLVVYLGSATGLDGINGATMSSAQFDDNSISKRPTVQVGDPFQQKLLMELCLEIMDQNLIVGIQDMGAAGLTSSIYEMAARGGHGIKVDLDLVPQRNINMTPFELMLSESQERMLMVCTKESLEKIVAIAKKWQVEIAVIGSVVQEEDVSLYWHGELISKLNPKLLTEAVPLPKWHIEEPADFKRNLEFDFLAVSEPEGNYEKIWLELLSSPNLCSKAYISQQYDSTICCNTVSSELSDAAVIRIRNSKKRVGNIQIEKGIALSLDCNSRYCSIDPHLGTALSIAESIRNITSVGATPIGISNCLNFGSPEKPTSMWQFVQSVKGMNEALRAFEIPVVSGNVSLYNETKGKGILPTPEIAMVGLIDDVTKAISSNFIDENDEIIIIGNATDSGLGGSEYLYHITSHDKGALPCLNYEHEIKTNSCIRELINNRLLKSCHDISQGGMCVALAKCCFANKVGATISITYHEGRKDSVMFAEDGARFIVSTSSEKKDEVISFIQNFGLTVSAVGKVGGDEINIVGLATLNLEQAYNQWSQVLESIAK